MLAALLRRGTAEDLVETRLEFAESNAAARGSDDRPGFVVVGRRARYYPDGPRTATTRCCSPDPL